MKSYALKSGALFGVIPGVGRVTPDRILTGDYDRFVPSVLRVVPTPVAEPEPLPPVLAVSMEPVVDAGTAVVVVGDVATDPGSSASAAPDDAAGADAAGADAGTIDLPPPDTTSVSTTSATVAVPPPPRSGRGAKRS